MTHEEELRFLEEMIEDMKDQGDDNPEAKAKREAQIAKMEASREAYKKFREFIVDGLQNDTITVSGDTSHMSIAHYLKTFAKRHENRKYDFQDHDVNFRDAMRVIDRYFSGMSSMTVFMKLINAGHTIDEVIAGNVELKGTNSEAKCYDCCEPLSVTVKGNTIHFASAKGACQSNRYFTVDIDFPTGEVVYGDWPDRFSEMEGEGFFARGDADINYMIGERKTAEEMAKFSILHMFVGNSCPRLGFNPITNAIHIGRTTEYIEYEGDDPEGMDEERDIPELAGFNELGYFCTDLWWVTMVDKSLYDQMLAKLPKKRDKRYYSKKLDVAKITPGRYRFTACYGMDPDLDDAHDTTTYVRAEYLGPCTTTLTLKNAMNDRIILTPKQMVIKDVGRWPELYAGQYEQSRFRVMDQIFNVNGNGIRSKADFLAYISVPAGTPISDVVPPDTAVKPKWGDDVRAPYPNFQTRYSLVGDCPMKDIPTDWLEEMIWFYNECINFFNGPNVSAYSHAYPCTSTIGSSLESWTESLAKRRKEGQTDAEHYAAITKDYECEFNGDVEEFVKRRWATELARIMSFINDTIAAAEKELKKRKKTK